MDEQEEHIAALQVKTEQINYEFIRAELADCSSVVESGIREIESGNLDSAHEESDKTEKGYKTVIGLVAELGEEQRIEIENLWNALRIRLDTLQTMIEDSAQE